MALSSGSPETIYRAIAQRVDAILQQIGSDSSDPALQKAEAEAHSLLIRFQQQLAADIDALEKVAEWDTFTIAFYGETNAGKSTLIETLRILLGEPTRLEQQRQFRALQQQHGLTGEQLLELQRRLAIQQAQLEQAQQALAETIQPWREPEQQLQQQIAVLDTIIERQLAASSLWQKLLSRLIGTPEAAERKTQRRALKKLQQERDAAALTCQIAQQVAGEQVAKTRQQHQQLTAQLQQLSSLADGAIIGDGRSDFTLATASYRFNCGEQQFALLDVPGIEGKEDKVGPQIYQAVQKAHAVFYVTSKAAAPQQGDKHNPGTLEKIKAHLGAQTEVWTLFNKRITNAMKLKSGSLVSGDEQHSLDELNHKMREQLGDNYRDVCTLSALPAFLAVAEHLVPASGEAEKREKFLAQLDKATLLEKTGLNAFRELLTGQLVSDCKHKIARANLNKALGLVEEVTDNIGQLQQQRFAPLAAQLQKDMENANALLDNALSSLKNRLLTQSDTAVQQFRNQSRRAVYEEIDRDISNDSFKDALEQSVKAQHRWLEDQLPILLKAEIGNFQQEIADIVQRFQQYAKSIVETYSRLEGNKFDSGFELKIDIDNGLRLKGLLATLAGGALLWWNPAGWLVLGPALASMAFALYKAVRGFFSAKYKMSQQKKSADENLNRIASHINASLHSGLQQAFPELEAKVAELKTLIHQPVEQAKNINHLLIKATAEISSITRLAGVTGAE